MKILVVDDNISIRKLMSDYLESLGFSEITHAENGLVALEISQKELPDIITLDWNMPEMDGLEYLKALRKLPNGQKPVVVFCSTEKSTPRIQQAMAAGANEYITKPFTLDDVQNKFQKLGLL